MKMNITEFITIGVSFLPHHNVAFISFLGMGEDGTFFIYLKFLILFSFFVFKVVRKAFIPFRNQALK